MLMDDEIPILLYLAWPSERIFGTLNIILCDATRMRRARLRNGDFTSCAFHLYRR